jgi:hypothetical protein
VYSVWKDTVLKVESSCLCKQISLATSVSKLREAGAGRLQ